MANAISTKNKLSSRITWLYLIWFFITAGSPSKLIAKVLFQEPVSGPDELPTLGILAFLLIVTVYGVVKSVSTLVIFSSAIMALFGLFQLWNGIFHLYEGSGMFTAIYVWLCFTIPSFIFLYYFIRHFFFEKK